MQMQNIKQHMKSERHARSRSHFVAKLLRGAAGADSIPAPSVDEFDLVLNNVRKGTALGGKLPRNKAATIAWCMFEAPRDEDRRFVSKAACMTLCQDARDGRFLTRFVASSSDPHQLRVRTGVLRMQCGGAGAIAIRDATSQGLKALATKRAQHGTTMYNPRVAPSLDKAFLNHTRRLVEVLVADGAADEQLAGRLLLPGSGRTDGNDGVPVDTLPNLRFVVRDKAHASRRR